LSLLARVILKVRIISMK